MDTPDWVTIIVLEILEFCWWLSVRIQKSLQNQPLSFEFILELLFILFINRVKYSMFLQVHVFQQHCFLSDVSLRCLTGRLAQWLVKLGPNLACMGGNFIPWLKHSSVCVCVCVFVCVLHIFCFIVKSYWWPFFFHTPLDSFMLQQPSFPFARCNLQYSVVN